MEINLGNKFGGNMGVSSEMLGAEPMKVSGRKAEDQAIKGQGITTSESSTFDPIKDSEPTTDVPESVLNRDDALGTLINSVFSLPAPPMPNFGG